MELDGDDKLGFSVGFGHYRDQNAAAMGAFYQATDDIMFSVGSVIGNGDTMFNAGASFRFGPGNSLPHMSKSAMVKKINEQSQQINDQNQRISDQNQKISDQNQKIEDLEREVQELHDLLINAK
jgi:trimeric autotransporter adhesin